MSGKVVNLKQARKRKSRSEVGKQADQNAALYGRSKAERDLEAAQKKADIRYLDQHKIDGSEL